MKGWKAWAKEWLFVLSAISCAALGSIAFVEASHGHFLQGLFDVGLACLNGWNGFRILRAATGVPNGRHRKSSTSPSSNASGRTSGAGHISCDPATAGTATARINADYPAKGSGLGPYRDGIIRQLAAELTHEGLVACALLNIEATLRERGYGAGINEQFTMGTGPAQGGPVMLITVTCGYEPKPLPASKIEFGEIVAYRAWVVKRAAHPARFDKRLTVATPGYSLRSLFAGVEWPPDAPLKSKIADHYLTAGGGGIHAFKTADAALAYAYGYSQSYPNDIVAVGKVRLFGEVIEHETGYRAEFARVGSIDQFICLEREHSIKSRRDVEAIAAQLRAAYCQRGIVD